MNIYALKGHKVKCVTLSDGWVILQEVAKKHLEIGKEYTVEHTEVYMWDIDVYLQEIPNVAFSYVFFEDVSEQLSIEDKLHPDYSYYDLI